MTDSTRGPLYIVTERFDAGCGEKWDTYLSWSHLSQLVEIVSLDSILCPPVVDEILPEDWPHIVNEDFMANYFVDLDHLLQRVGHLRGRNLLCVYRNPTSHPDPLPTPKYPFRHQGYDLVETGGGISPLTNCDGFPEAYANSELSSNGLLPSLERANEVLRALEEHYPDEHHARCDVWAIFRYDSL